MDSLNQGLSELLEDLAIPTNTFGMTTLGPLYSYILVNGQSGHLPVKISAQRIRFAKLSDSDRKIVWIAFKKHLDYWLSTGYNRVESILPTVFPLGLDLSVVYMMMLVNELSPIQASSLLMGIYLMWKPAGWATKELTPVNSAAMYNWLKLLITKNPSDKLYGNAVEALKAFTTEDKIEEVLSIAIDAFESPRFVSDAHAVSVFRNLYATYGEGILDRAKPLYEKEDSDSLMRRLIEVWLRNPNVVTTFPQEK